MPDFSRLEQNMMVMKFGLSLPLRRASSSWNSSSMIFLSFCVTSSFVALRRIVLPYALPFQTPRVLLETALTDRLFFPQQKDSITSLHTTTQCNPFLWTSILQFFAEVSSLPPCFFLLSVSPWKSPLFFSRLILNTMQFPDIPFKNI